jgi:hypothetical protein
MYFQRRQLKIAICQNEPKAISSSSPTPRRPLGRLPFFLRRRRRLRLGRYFTGRVVDILQQAPDARGIGAENVEDFCVIVFIKST